MSLLGLGQMLAGLSQNGPAALLPALLEQVKAYPGGIPALLERFRAGGLGEVVSSWIAQGPNLPVSPEQLREVLPTNMVDALSGESGLSVDNVLGQLSRVLPGLVDRVSPDGVLPENLNLNPAALLGVLGGLFGKSA